MSAAAAVATAVAVCLLLLLALWRLWRWTPPPPPSVVVAVLAVFKQEGHVLDEWIRHYVAEGVERFYLVENGGPDDGWRAVLAQQPPGRVDWHVDARRHAQEDLYNACLRDRILADPRGPPTWLIVCDLDEFWFATGPGDTLAAWLTGRRAGQVLVRWTMFGSAGHVRPPPEGVVRGFRRRAAYPLDRLYETKAAVRPEAVQRLHIHEHVLHPGWETERYAHRTEADLARMPLRINHYAVQARQWFLDVKARRGDAAWAGSDHVRDEAYFRAQDFDDVRDDLLATRHPRAG